jgi:dihydrofolate reductase
LVPAAASGSDLSAGPDHVYRRDRAGDRSSGEEGEAVQTELLLSCDAVLMGRRTYEAFAAVWPTRSGDTYSGRINVMPKFVASRTLIDPEGKNTTVLGGDLISEVRELKAQPGRDIVQYGFGSVSYALLEHGLLDELRLWIHHSSSAPADRRICSSGPGHPRCSG